MFQLKQILEHFFLICCFVLKDLNTRGKKKTVFYSDRIYKRFGSIYVFFITTIISDQNTTNYKLKFINQSFKKKRSVSISINLLIFSVTCISWKYSRKKKAANMKICRLSYSYQIVAIFFVCAFVFQRKTLYKSFSQRLDFLSKCKTNL